jgi:hypothetical protein
MNALPMRTGAPPPCARAHSATVLPTLRNGRRSSMKVSGLAAGNMLTPPPTRSCGVPSRGINASAASSLGVKLVR